MSDAGVGGGRILVVDDNEQIPRLIREALGTLGYHVDYESSPVKAQERIEADRPDLILLDYDMPGKSGLQVLSEIRKKEQLQLLPVVMLTGDETPGLKLSAFKQGATDFLQKPFSNAELTARVANLLKQKFLTDELEVAGNVIWSMSEIVDQRDHYTCGHCARVARYAELLGKRAKMNAREIFILKKGAFFHDIGKIAVRDNVLLKPGRLTPEEFEHVKIHPVKGFEILERMRTMKDVLPIVRHHHEKLDGSGYPDGISGNAIPVPARIVAIADIYDALTTDRPYRKAFSGMDAFQIMEAEAKKGWWDAGLLKEFKDVLTR